MIRKYFSQFSNIKLNLGKNLKDANSVIHLISMHSTQLSSIFRILLKCLQIKEEGLSFLWATNSAELHNLVSPLSTSVFQF